MKHICESCETPVNINDNYCGGCGDKFEISDGSPMRPPWRPAQKPTRVRKGGREEWKKEEREHAKADKKYKPKLSKHQRRRAAQKRGRAQLDATDLYFLEHEYDWNYVESEGRTSVRYDWKRGSLSLWVEEYNNKAVARGHAPKSMKKELLKEKVNVSEVEFM